MVEAVERAWAAGFFEGEGCVTQHKGRIRVAVTQNGGPEARALLERFQAAVGVGNITGPYTYVGSLGTKPRWTFQVYSTKAHLVMEALLPHMRGPKAWRYRELLAEAQLKSGGERTP